MVKRRNLTLPRGYAALDAASYPAFRAALFASECDLCPLAAGRSHIVVDRGSPSARILLVGEAPGAEEDRLGRAFVGRSGRLLDEMLIEAGLDPERDILIANVVKCRPPANRPPKPEEARKCLPYLRRQIELTRPRIVGLLGATAVKHLLVGEGAGRLKGLVGKLIIRPEFPETDLMVLFHPAYILRNRRRMPEMVRHLRGIRDRLAEVVREEIPLN